MSTIFAVFATLLPFPSLATAQLPYETDYPVMRYQATEPDDRVAQLNAKLESGAVALDFDSKSGYLASLLGHLDISVASQMLVFSRTSFQAGLVSPRTPRAVYFADDVYVSWVQGGDQLEIASLDRDIGPVFYTLRQDADTRPEFERQTRLCLQCHDSFSLTGDGVPRFLMGSGLPDSEGNPVFHEGWFITTDQSPLRLRWGGWYVTGTHGDQLHMGNLAVNLEDAAELDYSTGANVTDLGSLFDTGPYLGEHSDIVALMVMEHQVHLQNQLTKVHWDAEMALAAGPPTPGRVEEITEPLVRALLFVGEAPLTSPIAGTSGFAAAFERRGPRDEAGRSLRDLDLSERLFRYPLSYLIYSEAFEALPQPVKSRVDRRLREVLTGGDDSPDFAHLSGADRAAILEILQATKPDFRD